MLKQNWTSELLLIVNLQGWILIENFVGLNSKSNPDRLKMNWPAKNVGVLGVWSDCEQIISKYSRVIIHLGTVSRGETAVLGFCPNYLPPSRQFGQIVQLFSDDKFQDFNLKNV